MHIANLFSADSLVFYFLLATCFLLSQSLARDAKVWHSIKSAVRTKLKLTVSFICRPRIARLSVQIVTTESLLLASLGSFCRRGAAAPLPNEIRQATTSPQSRFARFTEPPPTSSFISLSVSAVALPDSAAADFFSCSRFFAYNQRLTPPRRGGVSLPQLFIFHY